MPFDGIRNSVLVRTLADVLDDLPDLVQKRSALRRPNSPRRSSLP